MKFLTVFFIILYGWRLISQQKTYKSLIQEIFVGKRQKEMGNILIDRLKEGDKSAIALIVFMYWTILLTIIEAFYVLFAIQYGNIHILIAYIIFWITILIVGKIKSVINDKRNELITEKQTRYSIKQMLINIVDLMFFVYMFVVIFIK